MLFDFLKVLKKLLRKKKTLFWENFHFLKKRWTGQPGLAG